MKILETERLILRTWKPSDCQPMLDINQDPQVMEYFPRLQDLATTKKLIETINEHQKEHNFSLYATELKETNEFIGFIGLITIDFDAHFTPAVEIGWRLSRAHWGKGYAPEGARVVLDYGFRELHLPEIVSVTAVENKKSRRVMEKIGLHYDPADDFDHPKLADDSPLKRHVVYRLSREQYFGA